MRWPWHRGKPESDERFGFAVVGLGHGAAKFLHAVKGSPTVGVTALISGDAAKAQRIARAHHVPAVYSYAEFERIAENQYVHAVYLCLPNTLHHAFAERALQAGKHVLCEKPMATTSADCRHMVETAAEANRLLMVGYRLAFTSVHARMQELLTSGDLGEVRAVRSGFGFRARGGWRLDPALAGGGSLFDVGIYAVNTLHTLFGAGFSVDTADITRDALSGMELATTWHGALSNGASLACSSSYLTKIPDAFEVQTTRATLTLEPAFSYQGLRLRVRAHAARDRDALDLDLGTPRGEVSAFRLEAEHLAACARSGLTLRSPGEHGLRDVETLLQVIAKAREVPARRS